MASGADIEENDLLFLFEFSGFSPSPHLFHKTLKQRVTKPTTSE